MLTSEEPVGSQREGGEQPVSMAAALDTWIEATLRELRERAEQERLGFEARLREAGRGRPRSAWGPIAVRIRDQRGERATPGAFSIEWVSYRFGNGRSGPLYFSEYLRKGVGDRYPRTAFRGVVRDWQRPLVEEAEDGFARLRHVARRVAEVRTQFRATAKLLAQIRSDGAGG